MFHHLFGALAACAAVAAVPKVHADEAGHTEGRLAARPGAPTAAPARPGLHRLGLGGERDALLYVPRGYTPERPAGLVVMLHGAGGSARSGLRPFEEDADRRGRLLLAIDARGATWDAVLGGFGPDVAFIDRALAHVFATHAVDPARVAVEGFSDGASYALSLGLANGDLFRDVVAFAPGFVVSAAAHGKPRVFVAHGREDRVLPIDRCSRWIVPRLRQQGLDVRYEEFDGGHGVPARIADAALRWLDAPQG
jgi:phospholipase/carboxylesterase